MPRPDLQKIYRAIEEELTGTDLYEYADAMEEIECFAGDAARAARCDIKIREDEDD
jgi:hypothetical protein